MLHMADLEPQNGGRFGDSADSLFSAPAMLWKPPQGHFFEENAKSLDSLDLLTNRLRSNAAQGHRCKRMKTPKITKNRPPGVSMAWPAQKIMSLQTALPKHH